MASSLDDFAAFYAEKIRVAIGSDAVARKAYYLRRKIAKQAAVGTPPPLRNLTSALQEIGTECEAIVDEATDETISEEEKQYIANEIAKALGWKKPRTLRRLIKKGSVDALMDMSQEMEDFFTEVKK